MPQDRKPTEKSLPAITEDMLAVTQQVGSTSSRPPGSVRGAMIDHDWLTDETAVSRTTETSIEVPPQARERNRAALRVLSGFNAGQMFALDARETVIGRGREAQVRLEDAGVSRRHSRIVHTLDGRFMVEDLGSTNGTFVDGRKIDRVEIQSGAQIQIGPNVQLSFALIDEAEERLARQLYESSTRDALTRAFNRKYFAERMTAEVAYANRHRSRLAVVLFDLDHFKQVNDTHGHLAGDEVLKQIAYLVGRTIRTEDLFARYGGEEFAILVRGIEHRNVIRFAERLRKAAEALMIQWQEVPIRQTISIGVASLNERAELDPAAPKDSGEDLLLLADERLYRAKSEGRNRVVG